MRLPMVVMKMLLHVDDFKITAFVIFLDFHSTKQGQALADSWSRGLD